MWSAIGAAVSGTSNLASAYLSYKEARAQRSWMEKMSNTAHQREVKDLRKAGLNPVLSAMGGSGATTPTASTADMSSIGEIGNSALAWRQQKNNNKLADAEVKNKEVNSELVSEQIHNAIVGRNNETKLVSAQVAKYMNDIQNDNSRLMQEIKESTARIGEHSANAKYQNERARGYTQSDGYTDTEGGNINIPLFGYGKNKSYTYHRSETR